MLLFLVVSATAERQCRHCVESQPPAPSVPPDRTRTNDDLLSTAPRAPHNASLAASATCARCAKVMYRGRPNFSCCHSGGSWAGACGDARAHTYGQGYTECIARNEEVGRRGARRARPPAVRAEGALQLASDKYATIATHRGGWGFIMARMMARGSVFVGDPAWREPAAGGAAPLLFVDCPEVFFIWERVVLTRPWVAIVHAVGGLPTYANDDTVEGLLRDPHWVASLPSCRLIIALSWSLAAELAADARLAGIPIRVMRHPMGVAGARGWERAAFEAARPTRRVILLGSQYRRVSTIYRLRSPYAKAWMPGAGAGVSERQQRLFRHRIA